MLSAATPPSRAAHTAASTFSTLCAPRSGISATGRIGSAFAPSRGVNSTLSPCTNAPCLIGRRPLNQYTCAFVFAATICVGLSSAFSTRKSSAVCRAVIRVFIAA